MLSFADAPGNLFNRIGKLGQLIKQMRSYQASMLLNFTDTTYGVVAQLNAESDIQAQVGSAYIGAVNAANSTLGSIQGVATAIVNRQIYRDNPRYGQTLTSQNTLASIYEVIRQMKIAGALVLAQTITATPTSFTGVGNGVINTSVRRPLDGLVLENAFAETLLLVCTSDSYLGGATEGNETFALTGVGQQGDVFAFDWPLGSNASTSLSAIDGNVDVGSGNLLTNSGFESWATTTNVPDNWSLTVGTAGTNTLKETTIVYDAPPNFSLAIVGDGSTLTALKQQFDSSTGTTGTLEPLTQYGYNLFLRRDGTAAVAGVLTIDLIDGSNNVILDANSVANTFNIDLTALTTVFTSYRGQFRTPVIMPSAVYIRMRLSTALTNGRTVYLDKSSLGLMTQAYTSGPFACIHAGSIPFLQGDYGTIAITNSRGAAGTYSTFQTLWAQLFPEMISNEILLPSSSVPNISDANLIKYS